VWHKDEISLYWQKVYEDRPVLTAPNAVDWVSIDDTPYILFQSNDMNKNYLIPISAEGEIPVLVNNKRMITHRSKAYFLVEDWEGLYFRPEKKMSFKEMVDTFYKDFSHSKPEDFLFFKLIAILSVLDRVNIRVEAPRAFGKSFPLKILGQVGQRVSVVSPRSDSSIRMRLVNKTLVLDEISASGAEKIKVIQDFLLTAGAGDNLYEAPVRGSAYWGTQDIYDIADLSLIILHNPKEYYERVGQTYFEDLFTYAVLDRFLTLRLKGELSFTRKNIKEMLLEGHGDIDETKVTAWNETLEYFKENWKRELVRTGKADWLDYVRLESLSERKKLNLSRLIAVLAMYCPTPQVFRAYAEVLNEKLENNNPQALTMKDYIDFAPGLERCPVRKEVGSGAGS